MAGWIARLCAVAAGALAIGAAAKPAAFVPSQLAFDERSFLAQRITAPGEPGGKADGRGTRFVRIAVDKQGKVVSVKQRDDRALPAPLAARIRSWRFHPFEWRGNRVGAIADIAIDGHVPPSAMAKRAPPRVEEPWSITLRRGACFGTCPAYVVTVHSSGEVLFDSGGDPINGSDAVHQQFNGRNVLLPGRHATRISREAAAALLGEIGSANFFALRDRYVAQISDNPTYELRFTSPTLNKSVVDYAGSRAGMPAAVTALEDEIDRVADTERWIAARPDAVDALAAEGVAFDTAMARAMLDAGIGFAAPDEFFVRLIDRGIPLDTKMEGEGARQETLGDALLTQSWITGLPKTFARLDALGWTAHMNAKNLDFAFAIGAGCDASVARRLAALGANVNARDAIGGTALMNILSDESGKCRDKPVAEAVRALIGLGVDVNAVDDSGETALFKLHDFDALEILLRAGARVDIHSKAGQSPALAHEGNDRVTLGLLEAGADASSLDVLGQPLAESIRFSLMPGTRSWLDHPRGK